MTANESNPILETLLTITLACAGFSWYMAAHGEPFKAIGGLIIVGSLIIIDLFVFVYHLIKFPSHEKMRVTIIALLIVLNILIFYFTQYRLRSF